MAASDIVSVPLVTPEKPWAFSVIIVPDFTKNGTAPEKTHVWLHQMLEAQQTQAQIFRFQYQISMKGRSVWHQLSKKGEDLIELFRQKTSLHQIAEKNVILIGYGLGGLIVKRALTILSNPVISETNLRPRRNDFLRVISGVIFFGTPHVRKKENENWHRLTHLLKFIGGLTTRFVAQSQAEAKSAAIICDEFSDSGPQMKVVSIYETKDTKVKLGGRASFFKEAVPLVDEELATPWVMKQSLIPNDFDHEGVSTVLPGSSTQRSISMLLMSALSMPRQSMTARSIHAPSIGQQQDDLWEESIAQISIDGDDPNGQTSESAVSYRHGSSDEGVFGSSVPSNFDIIPSNDMGDYVADEMESNTWPCRLWGGAGNEAGFTGRDDTFAEINACFFPPASQTQDQTQHSPPKLPCCCISGLGGMGKTTTAIQYGYAHEEQFDAIFVVQADKSAKLAEQFSKIALALGLLETVDDDKEDNDKEGNDDSDLLVSRSKALKWLESPKFSTDAMEKRAKSLDNATSRDLKWLLLFDNVENPSILRDYWPSGTAGCILVTTRDARNSDYLTTQSLVTHISLDGLRTAPGSQLLSRLSYIELNESNSADAAKIVEKLGGLPLAIGLVAAYIFERRMTLENFFTLFEKTLLDRRTSNSKSTSWSHDIVTSWALNGLSAQAKSLIAIYSCQDPDGVQDNLLTDSLTNHQDRTLPEDCPDDEFAHIDARGELLKSSLVRGNLNIKPLVLGMHRLVQEISIARMESTQRNEVFSFVAGAIYDAWPFTENNWDHQAGLWSKQEMLLLHVFRLADIAKVHEIGGIQLAVKRKFIALLSASGWYGQERGDFDSGIPLLELGIKMCAKSPNDFLDLRADLSFGLGGATCDTNRWAQFLVHAQEQLDYRLRSDAWNGTGPTSNTAIAYSELGIAQALLGQYEEGIQNCDKAIELYSTQPEVLSGEFFPAFPHIHRALACAGAGRPQDGERGLLDLIDWEEKHIKPKQKEFKLGYAWHCCGLIYNRTGRQDESFAAYENAYFHYEGTVGHSYHRYGNVCGKIAEHYESLKLYEAADIYFSLAQMVYEKQSHYLPELARHYFIQSQALESRGESDAASAALHKARQAYEQIDPHAETAPLTLELLNGIVAPWVW